MALRISRRSTDCGRPPGLGLGIRGWTSFHWASVRSVGYFARLIPFSTPKTRGEVHFSHRLLGIPLILKHEAEKSGRLRTTETGRFAPSVANTRIIGVSRLVGRLGRGNLLRR